MSNFYFKLFSVPLDQEPTLPPVVLILYCTTTLLYTLCVLFHKTKFLLLFPIFNLLALLKTLILIFLLVALLTVTVFV